MNKKLFCILYNAAKGTWVVVRESALARGAARFCGCTPMLTRCGAVLLVLQPMFQLQAQVVAASEASAANRPVVALTSNQTPLVHIAAPNAAGVSNNHYSQFNVDNRGVILNNARGRAQTQLGGVVIGNPLLLASPSAGIILNQVVGHHPSLLTGSLEVAGARADVILANPNGIVCNGGGFINASRGVLTTGVPVLGAQGGLEAFRVSAGQLQIGPNGLKAADLDWVDLIARSVKVNGTIQAQGQLNVITGANRVAYANLGVEVLPGLAGKPTVGLDVGRLGGMYAHRIHLIGTAAGLGVHSQGTLAARGGFQCTQEGRIMLTGTTTAGGEFKLASQGDLANSGTLVGQGSVTLASQGAVHNLGTLQAKGDFNLKATGHLVNEGGLIAGEKVTVSVGALTNQGGAIKHGGPEAMRLTVKDTLDNSGGVIFSHGKDLHLRSARFTNDQGGQIAHTGTGTFSINTGALNNDTGLIVSKGSIGLAATQDLSNVAGTIHAEGFLRVHGTNIDNDGGQMVAHGGGLSVVADETLKNAAGTTAAGHTGGLISGRKDTVVQTRHLASSGAIMAGHYLSLRGTTLTTSGTLSAGTRIEVEAQTLANGQPPAWR